MSITKIAHHLVQLYQQGNNALAQVLYFDDEIVSIEKYQLKTKRTKGIIKVQRKSAHFFEMTQKIHTAHIEGPLIVSNNFCIKIDLDITLRSIGRIQLQQLIVYTVKNHKIIQEEFFY